jgi:hypothetical protein
MSKRTILPPKEKFELEQWLRDNIENPFFIDFKKTYPESQISHNTFERYRDRIRFEKNPKLILENIDKPINEPRFEKRHYSPRLKNPTPLYQTIGIINPESHETQIDQVENIINLINETCGLKIETVHLANGQIEVRKVQK